MMSVEDIAALYKCERDYARDVIVKLDGFPDPAPGSTRKFKRWLRRAVVAFIEGQE
jgi:hypothetical protein